MESAGCLTSHSMTGNFQIYFNCDPEQLNRAIPAG
jgi:hypothetical protein